MVKRLHDAFKQAMEQENYRTALARYDMVPIYMRQRYLPKVCSRHFERGGAGGKLGLAKPQKHGAVGPVCFEQALTGATALPVGARRSTEPDNVRQLVGRL